MKFCRGKLKNGPWSEFEGLQPETKIIDEPIGNINLKGFSYHQKPTSSKWGKIGLPICW